MSLIIKVYVTSGSLFFLLDISKILSGYWVYWLRSSLSGRYYSWMMMCAAVHNPHIHLHPRNVNRPRESRKLVGVSYAATASPQTCR